MGWATKHIENLQKGNTIQCRPSGYSMSGIIESKQLCTIAPINDPDDIKKGDVVLCKVNGRQFLHQVKAVKNGSFQIGNAKGYINGWTRSIYGKLIKVEP